MSIHAHEVRSTLTNRGCDLHARTRQVIPAQRQGLFDGADRVNQPHPGLVAPRERHQFAHHGRRLRGLRTDPAHLVEHVGRQVAPRRQHLDQPTHDLQGVVEFVRHVRQDHARGRHPVEERQFVEAHRATGHIDGEAVILRRQSGVQAGA